VKDKPDLGNVRKLTNNWDGVSRQYGTSINYTCQVRLLAKKGIDTLQVNYEV
jgi:hypothetical protein